jgi:tape measure domain-containing protein
VSVAVELGAAYISILPSTSKLAPAITREMGRAGAPASKSFGSKLTSGLGKTLKTVGKVGGAAMVGTLGAALVKGFGRLTAIENAEAKLKGLGHSAADVEKIMGSALAAVKGTAFGLDEAASVAASAVAAGVKPGKDLQRTLSLVADAATIGGTSMGEMGQIFNKVASTGKIQGEVIQQLGERGIPILQLLGKAIGKTPAEVSKLAAQGKIDFATFQKAMEEGMGGAALKSGETTQGAFKNMGAALSRFGATLLKGVFPIAKTVFGGLTKLLDKAGERVAPFAEVLSAKLAVGIEKVGRFFRENGPAIRDFASGLAGMAVDLGTALVPALGKTASALQSVAGFVKRNADFFIPFAAALGTAVVAFKTYVAIQKVVTAVTAAWNAVLAMNPIGLVVIALAALVAGLVVAYKRSDTFRAIVNAAFSAVKAVALSVFGWFTKTLVPFFTKTLPGEVNDERRRVSRKLTW